MSKQQINHKQTNVATQGGVGQQVEVSYTVSDSTLPSPQELSDYQRIDPNIVKFLMETAQKEQQHRHKMEVEKMKVVKSSESRTTRINLWGMFFAFLALVTLVGLSALALYLDKPWFAGIFGFTAVVSIVSVFINAGKNK